MTDISPLQDQDNSSPPRLLADFLENTPPGAMTTISDLRVREGNGYLYLKTPDLQLHCSSAQCGGTRFFGYAGTPINFAIAQQDVFLDYRCKNCDKTFKTYPLWVSASGYDLRGKVLKYGEWPPFGPPTPSRLIALVGPDRDAFLKGRRAEIQGLGIGAFAYYRRVVENQKDRLLDQIIEVAQRTGAKPENIKALEAAKLEQKFSKAVDQVKDAIPETLRVDGHNPLTLLHQALSEGLHAGSDEECLELATSIRVVLQDLAERSAAALKDHAELRAAVSRLFKKGSS